MVNLFGDGFIGSHFRSKYPCITNRKADIQPIKICQNVLYTISTVDNYNVLVNPYIDIDTNLTHLVRVLEQFKIMQDKTNNRHVFNFVSSWFVYGDCKLPATEKSYCNPKGFYSITKRTAEQLLISYCETYNLDYRIFRLANVIGDGDEKVSKRKNALTYLLNKIKTDQKIELYHNGYFYRDYIHVDDVIDIMFYIMGTSSHKNEIFNISNGKKIMFRDLIDHAMSSCGSKSKIISVKPTKFHDIVQVKDMVLDNSKIKSLGYEPKIDILDFISRYVND
mgnify:CR=1 FL=1